MARNTIAGRLATLREWLYSFLNKLNWPPENEIDKGFRSPHFWILFGLMAFGAFTYYVDQTPLVNVPPFNGAYFTTVHDIHRTLFYIPILYATIVFRVRGALITSGIFLLITLPRALYFSPFPNPLLRALAFFGFAALTSVLLALEFNRVDKERGARKELAAAYQKLSEYDRRLREGQEQLIQAEKLTSLGQLAASIAHEINNPLTGVLVYTQLLIKKMNNEGIPKETALNYLAKMEQEIARSGKLVRSLLDFARQSHPSLKDVNINDMLNRALELPSAWVSRQRVNVVKEYDTATPALRADPDQLQQVFTNLILNAIQAMPNGGTLTLHTSASEGYIRVEVRDTGCGISPENINKLFTPFFTTKEKGKGVGLGLAVAYGIIQRHHGRIEVKSKEGEGTTFIIHLPLHYEEQ